MKPYLLALACVLALSGCAKSNTDHAGAAQEALVQDKVCEVHDWQTSATAACKPGQKIAFLPNSWGNEQLPILFAAVNCDMRYTVSMNNGGVVCIHAKMQVETPKPDGAAK